MEDDVGNAGDCDEEDTTCFPPRDLYEDPYELTCIPPCLPGASCMLKSLPEFRIYTVRSYEQLYNVIKNITDTINAEKTEVPPKKSSSSKPSGGDFYIDPESNKGSIPQEPHSISIRKKEPINVFFTCAKSKSGKMWDPVSERVEYLLDRFTDTLMVDRNIHFVKVRLQKSQLQLGSEFERDPNIRLWAIPMLMQWGGPQRLDVFDFYNDLALRLFFEEEQVKTPVPIEPRPTCRSPPPEQEIVQIVVPQPKPPKTPKGKGKKKGKKKK